MHKIKIEVNAISVKCSNEEMTIIQVSSFIDKRDLSVFSIYADWSLA